MSNPTNPKVRYLDGKIALALCHLRLGDNRTAKELLKQVLERDSKHKIALRYLAQISHSDGEHNLAYEFVHCLLQMAPSDEEAQRVAQ